ncbi:class I SAM-dependent methyltransferase [bacterium]|nr:class I SAM-dependent methyltransferase [bacterium]
MHKAIHTCRICSHADFDVVVDLGSQALTGVFPRSEEEHVPVGPLELIKCREATGGCGLVQLRHSYEPDQMYGENYGYRSGLNQSMVRHLQRRVREATAIAQPTRGDVILDIGSNDSTTLQAYGNAGYRLLGIDPSARKFLHHYPDWVDCVTDFFSAGAFRAKCGDAKAKIVTSISMFYDLEDPTDFMRQVSDVLADDGIWVFEQSYLPLMIDRDAYDTICHEHVSYYALRQIKWMTDRVGLEIVDVELNDINGGSFCVTVAKAGSRHRARAGRVEALLAAEVDDGYGGGATYDAFRDRVVKHRDELTTAVRALRRGGQLVCGYGASTKGNVLLQYCNFTRDDLPVIAEVNQDKFGCFTPGTRIPIASEREVKDMRPDVLLVLPWHFRDNICQREDAFLEGGGRLLFPLPSVEYQQATPRRAAA